MRRTGKTTRLIDAAVQTLFTTGFIYIPTKSQLLNKVNPLKRIMRVKNINDSQVFYDLDEQNHFYKCLKRRLYTEHHGSFEEKDNMFIVEIKR